MEDGSCLVKNLKKIVTSRAEIIERKPDVVLCRCGGSNNKPFCDGTHWHINYKDEKDWRVVMEIFGESISFWTGFIAGLFILLHIPSCNKHWAARLRPFSIFLTKYHDLTLDLATGFAIIHLVLDLIGLISGVWI